MPLVKPANAKHTMHKGNKPDMTVPKDCDITYQVQLDNKTSMFWLLNPIALRKAKIVYNFGLSECNRVKLEV